MRIVLATLVVVPQVAAQFNLGGNFKSDKCTMSMFESRVKEIDEACCKGKGADVCPLGTPIRCDLECGLEYLSFFDECQNLIMGLSAAPQPVVVYVGPSRRESGRSNAPAPTPPTNFNKF